MRNQDVSRNLAPPFMPSVQGSSGCSGYEPAGLERPMWQLQAGSHQALDALRHTAADLLQHRRKQAATDALGAGVCFLFFLCFFFLNYRGIVHPPSDDEGTERTWLEPEQRPRKRVPKRSVQCKRFPRGAIKTSWRQDDQL